MTRELYLLRHGKSAQNSEMEDFDRPLKKRGELAAIRIGKWLKQEQLIPDYIVSSPAHRAIATAIGVYQAIGGNELQIVQDKRLYMKGSKKIISLLAEIPVESSRVLLVGHNPDLEDLLGFLIGSQNLPLTDKLLPTAAMARLTMPADWSQLSAKCATLLSITYAKTLILNDTK
jgi:phosphohistidine phosphatase